MTPEEREELYDREIAPALLAIARKCEDNGISMATIVEWEPGETGRTATLSATAGAGIRMAELATRCHGNADTLILALMKHAGKHGHSSICLKQLGVPTEAATAA